MSKERKLDRYAKEVHSVGVKCRVIERLRMGLSKESEMCNQHENTLTLLR